MKIIKIVLVLVLIGGCANPSVEIAYNKKVLTVEDSEFGVVFMSDDFDGISYYIDNSIYRSPDKSYYAQIEHWKNKGDKWIHIKGTVAVDVDSTSVDFKRCKKMPKKVLLKL